MAKPDRSPGGPPLGGARARTRRGGLTLIELLVSITILTMMILAFSTIMVQSQRFISVAQATRRSHQLASSIARIIRRDVRRASQNGFLAVAEGPGNEARLAFSAAGTVRSLLGGNKGSGSVVVYGLVNNSVHNERDVLYRPEYVMNRYDENGSFTATRDDEVNVDFANLQVLPRLERDACSPGKSLEAVATYFRDLNPTLRVPPGEDGGIAAINDLWQALAVNCSEFSVMWTDGTLRQNTKDLNWFGIDPEGQSQAAGNNEIEVEGASGYLALWTHNDQTNWPKAIKIRFTITDINMPREFRGANGMKYEVICNIGE